MWKWLIQTVGFVPRSHCGPAFTHELILNSQIADSIIFVAYSTIPLSLSYLWLKKRKDLPTSFILILFSHFIFLCGITHLNNVFAFTWPAYHYFIVVEDLTAIASLITAMVMPFVIIKIKSLPSFNDLQLAYIKINDLHQHNILELALRHAVEKECKENNQQLRQQVEKLEEQVKHEHWLGDKYEALEELKRMLEKKNENF